MRLIDKDELLTKVDKEWGLWVEVVNVMYAPEVNAIPIEWIEKYIEEVNIRDYGTIFIQPCGSITQMLKDWEKENEKNV